MKMNLSLLKKRNSYYAPVAGGDVEVVDLTKPSAYRLFEGKDGATSLVYSEGGNEYWINARGGVVLKPNGTYTVGLFEATQDFEFNGVKVAKGNQKYFAY